MCEVYRKIVIEIFGKLDVYLVESIRMKYSEKGVIKLLNRFIRQIYDFSWLPRTKFIGEVSKSVNLFLNRRKKLKR